MSTETGTPSPVVAPAEPPVSEGQAPPPEARPKVDVKRLNQGVQRVVQGRQQEKAWQQEKAGLGPVLRARDLIAQGKFAEGFRAMTGDEHFVPGYKSLTEQVLGQQGEEKALEALPASVRAQLAKVKALEEESSKVRGLEERLAAFEKQREEAAQQLQAQRQQQAILSVFQEGLQAAGDVAGELELLPAHPDAQRVLHEEWVRLCGEKAKTLGAMPLEERKAAMRALVAEAARAVDKALVQQHAWLLSTPHAGRTLGASRYPAPQSPAPAPPPKQPVKVSPPGSLGEPSGVDWENLPQDERFRRMREDERRNPYVRP